MYECQLDRETGSLPEPGNYSATFQEVKGGVKESGPITVPP